MNRFYIRLIIFLFLNFGALLIGGLYTESGVNSAWYSSLDKAPWTPPGWVFGTAWSTIMLALSIFMAAVTQKILPFNFKNKMVALYWPQIALNILWNPIFFYFHLTIAGLIVISVLTILVFAMYFVSKKHTTTGYRLLLTPYMIWLLIATSLNGYIVWMQ